MEVLRITKDTSEREISQFCKNHPQLSRKVITAQARFERRKARSEHNRRQQELEDGNYRED